MENKLEQKLNSAYETPRSYTTRTTLQETETDWHYRAQQAKKGKYTQKHYN